MPIFWTKAAQKIHLGVISICGVFLTFLPLSGLSLEISTPVGVQQIGKPLNLKSTLSKLPKGAESQLRSTCLRARMSALETSPDTDDSAVSSEVLVSFDSTIRHGGLIEFRSVLPVNDAIVEMELVSECPLVVFSTTWTLIMTQGDTEPNSAAGSRSVSVSPAFDLDSSSLLASSRQPPAPKVDDKPVWLNNAERSEVQPRTEVEEAAQVVSTTSVHVGENASEAVKVASLDTDLLGAGLIESRRDTSDMSGGLGLDSYTGEAVSSSELPELLLPVSLGSFVLLMISFLVYRQYSAKKVLSRSGVGEQGHNGPGVTHSPQDLTSISREHVIAFSGEPTNLSVGSSRVLESLIGNDEQDLDKEINSPFQEPNSGSLDPSCRSSLKISLELINRADIPSWTLPASYLGLVESRNRSLELHRTLDALLLRSQIGLVELAFQDAKQGQLTSAQSSIELLEQVLGDRLHDMESRPTLCVPDVVKSHVRAKMCEVAGAEKRQLLRENLVNLNSQVSSPALCFTSNAWREFLSEEGILD